MTGQPGEAQHGHARPSLDDQRAALAAARATLTGASLGAVHQAAETGDCPACTAVAGVTFLITATSTAAGDKLAVSERTRRVLLAAVEAAQRELDSAPN